MSQVFKTLPQYMPPSADDGSDPFERVNSIDTTDLSTQAASKKLGDVCRQIDWVPTELKQLVDAHRPRDSDIDLEGNVKKKRLQEEATKLFTKLQKESTFSNFYQFQQAVNRFSDAWGFVVSTQSNTQLVCFYSKSSRKERDSVVSPGRSRNKSSLKHDCPFVIKTSFDQTKKNFPRHRKPVRITGFNLEHTCEPGVMEARVAKKSAGAIFRQLDLSELKDRIDTIVDGNMKGHQIRKLLRKHIPDGYDISSDALRNFRARALKYYLEETPLDMNSAEKLLKFQPLDSSEAIVLPNSDLCRKKVCELMLQVMNGKDGGWKAKDFLQVLKMNSPGFDYRMKVDENDGSPTALIWMTPTMRIAWIRFGNVMFADMMKRKMSSLHWPYVSLVGLDHENRVSRFGECLCLAEDLEYYAWSIRSLEEMEPRRAVNTIRLLYADGIMSDTILTLLGLERPIEISSPFGTDVVSDSFHLLSSVWPLELGQRVFDRLSADLNVLVYGGTRESYDGAWRQIVSKIGSDPTRLQYLKDYYDHPERFARHHIKRIPGNLGKTSSQSAEANHASIIAHLGPGSTQDMVVQINDLLSRQAELDAANTNADAKYRLVSAKVAREAEEKNMLQEAAALRTLSCFGYNEYWRSVVEESQHYSLLPDQDDEYDRVHRNGTSMESVRLVPKVGRCSCDFHLKANSMCPHEYLRGGCVFNAALFPERLFQPHAMTPIDSVSTPSQAIDGSFDDEGYGDETSSDVLFSNDVVDMNVNGGSDVVLSEGNTPGKKRKSNDTSLLAPVPPRKKRQQAIGHSQLIKEATQVANYAANATPQLREAVHTSLIMLREILEGTLQEAPLSVVETLQNATTGSTMMNRFHGQPKAGPEAKKQGAPRQSRLVSAAMARNGGTKPRQGGRSKNKCTFCGTTSCGNISTCVELKNIGRRISQNDLGSLVQNDLNPSNARMDEKAKAQLVSVDKPVLSSLPRGTKWLVIHGVHDLRTVSSATPTSVLQETQTGIEVSCLGNAGVTIDFGDGMNFSNRMTYYSVVRDWIASAGKTGCGKTNSRVIVSHSFNLPEHVNETNGCLVTCDNHVEV